MVSESPTSLNPLHEPASAERGERMVQVVNRIGKLGSTLLEQAPERLPELFERQARRISQLEQHGHEQTMPRANDC